MGGIHEVLGTHNDYKPSQTRIGNMGNRDFKLANLR